MEVINTNTETTHVVLSKQNSIAVSIVDSPELMHLLSGALYKNPRYSMIQEIICNAYDAHIEAGIPETPIQVSVTQDMLTITDFGYGIKKEEMGQIYGTYGLSFKRDKKDLTGGFGLGSKSPWSYSDTFSVTSCHRGTKTLYKLIKVDHSNKGKPGIVPVLDIPTEATGLTVSVPLNSGDYSTIMNYVEQVALKGNIPVQLNKQEKLCPRIPYEKAKRGFVLYRGRNANLITLNIKYGSVVYPIQRHEFYYDEYNTLTNTVNTSIMFGMDKRLILIAEPGTVTLSPSRDNLSLDIRTQKEIKRLLIQTQKHFDRALKTTKPHWKQVYSKMVKELTITHPDRLLTESFLTWIYNHPETKTLLDEKAITTLEELSVNSLKTRTAEKKVLLQSFLKHHHLIGNIDKKFIKALKRTSLREFSRRYFWEMDFSNIGDLALFLLRQTVGDKSQKVSWYIQSTKESLTSFRERHHSTLFFLKKRVVLTTKATQLCSRLPPEENKSYALVVQVRKNQKAIDELAAHLTAHGYTVINIADTVDMPRHRQMLEERREARKLASKSVKTPPISSVHEFEHLSYYIRGLFAEEYTFNGTDTHRFFKGKPDAFIWLPLFENVAKEKLSSLLGINGYLGPQESLFQIKGKKIAVINCRKLEKQLEKEGIPQLESFLSKQRLMFVKEKEKELKDYFAKAALSNAISSSSYDFASRRACEYIIDNKILSDFFGITTPTSFDRDFLIMQMILMNVSNKKNKALCGETVALLSSYKETPVNQKDFDTLKKYSKSKLLDLFNMCELKHLIQKELKVENSRVLKGLRVLFNIDQ